MKKYCKRNGCINEALPEDLVRDTPLCEGCTKSIQAIIAKGVNQA